MEHQPKVLICDDNIAVHESLTAYLKAENIQCVSAYDGKEALNKIKNTQFDLMILDIMMPKMSGTDVCREIRKTSEVPIIMLSARGEEFDRILGLEIGADDYITKPFSPREVVARIKAVLKRVQPQTLQTTPSERIVIGQMTIDVECYEVTIGNQKIELTPKEIEMLIYLSRNKNKVLTREQILNQVWGYDYLGDTRAVDTLIKRLRKKLPASGLNFEIKSVYSIGYKLEVGS
ncbi:MAG: response regulator [Acidaminobacter sp.]|uniref:response regulator transcription factor n=1 Tax=Acidaminobacter sp. TaxID=1872102 RepID=UPI00137D18C4|nr:response regulator transcription factor [Acidaminobacter sp.]MZQ97045.1 response regulator [Acidaminobacter sp.]